MSDTDSVVNYGLDWILYHDFSSYQYSHRRLFSVWLGLGQQGEWHQDVPRYTTRCQPQSGTDGTLVQTLVTRYAAGPCLTWKYGMCRSKNPPMSNLRWHLLSEERNNGRTRFRTHRDPYNRICNVLNFSMPLLPPTNVEHSPRLRIHLRRKSGLYRYRCDTTAASSRYRLLKPLWGSAASEASSFFSCFSPIPRSTNATTFLHS
ncbi:SAM binding motif containing protein [Pseudozyma hubeiensis SY62]|uniref:SAM binding motif containing protein n=1 Tax=Pseudozyma hubeiensis (strain SY62) TaxID=1305764 RepID=R9P9Z9_PSEHS|nr:SAM binding motif containing protein [Pseudozyma hubeiensis SY62]GAC98208.1 SAM binding motif containing protein [Pseudozyma hubeiensis SY62]